MDKSGIQASKDDPLSFILSPTKVKDLEDWKGWCELESEPVSMLLTDGLRPITDNGIGILQ
jgi:hypothetical protein